MNGSSSELLLASGSASRAALLRGAGVRFRQEAQAVDEEALRDALVVEGAGPRAVADALAECKALRASRRHPGALCLGCDQVLSLAGEPMAKPADLAAARRQLARLRGREHELHSAMVIARGGESIWRHADRARIRMRAFSDEFLNGYLERVGAAALASVGAYHLEGVGAQLMERVEGDYFTVLGLPLLPLLAYLRVRGVLEV